MWCSAQTKLFAKSIVVRDKRYSRGGSDKFNYEGREADYVVDDSYCAFAAVVGWVLWRICYH